MALETFGGETMVAVLLIEFEMPDSMTRLPAGIPEKGIWYLEQVRAAGRDGSRCRIFFIV